MKDNDKDNDKEDILSIDKSLQCVRVEINSHVTVFLYYKIYPKSDSKKFPQSRTALFFYFDHENVNEKFLKNYISLIGQIDCIEIGSYINKKGSKKKRRVVNFAIIKFIDEESLTNLMNRYETQIKINQFLEIKKNRNISLDYDTMKDVDDEWEEIGDDVDEDGFVKVSSEVNKKRFNKNGVSFKVAKQTNFEESDNKKKKHTGDFYWNHQVIDKKRQMYDELKNLFEEDKKAIAIDNENANTMKKQFKKPKIV